MGVKTQIAYARLMLILLGNGLVRESSGRLGGHILRILLLELAGLKRLRGDGLELLR